MTTHFDAVLVADFLAVQVLKAAPEDGFVQRLGHCVSAAQYASSRVHTRTWPTRQRHRLLLLNLTLATSAVKPPSTSTNAYRRTPCRAHRSSRSSLRAHHSDGNIVYSYEELVLEKEARRLNSRVEQNASVQTPQSPKQSQNPFLNSRTPLRS